MIGKKYRLQTVLEMRGRVREEAGKTVALKLEQLAKAEEELNRRRRQLQACYERQARAQKALQTELTSGTQAREVIGHQTFLQDLKNIEAEIQQSIEEQIRVVAKAEREVEAAREKLLEAAKDLKVIEKHKDNWSEERRTTENRRAGKISDEIGSILYNRRDKS